MTYVPGYEWDVFVSFANNDNNATREEDKWVNGFVRDLRIGIKNWIGNADQLKVFFEEDSISANLELPTLKRYAEKSAIFVAIASPSYIRRGWPLEELRAFCNGDNTSGRLFVIECRPAGDYALFPEHLRNISAAPFFIQDRDARVPRPLTLEQDARDWKNRMSELTKDISDALQKCKGRADGASASTVSESPRSDLEPSPNSTVLLAQTTDDLMEQCDDVRRYLTQAGYTVLPRQGLYPQGGEQFKAAFKADLERANFYVQLLGSLKSRRDPDLEDGYARFQFETAKAAARDRAQLKTFCWRPIYLDLDQIKHEDADLLSDPTVVAMTLESFKNEVQSSIERVLEAVHNHGHDGILGRNLTVYINAAPDDEVFASAVSDECAQQGFTAVMQPSENSALDLFREVKKSFGICNAYFLVFGKADTLWAVRQGASFSKLSAQYAESELPQVIAIIDGPPEEKNPLPIRLPRSRVINCRKSLDPMRQVLAELRP